MQWSPFLRGLQAKMNAILQASSGPTGPPGLPAWAYGGKGPGPQRPRPRINWKEFTSSATHRGSGGLPPVTGSLKPLEHLYLHYP